MILTIVRHGESRQQVEAAEQMNPDSGLSERGRAQAGLCGRRLREIRPQRLIASPLKRALETAREIAHACELETVEVWEDVREGLGASFVGHELAGMLNCCPQAQAEGLFGGGPWVNARDTRESFFTRCESAFRRLSEATSTGGHTVLVTHGAFANWLIHLALEIPTRDDGVAWFELDNASITQFKTVDGPQPDWPVWWLYPSLRLRVLRVNDTSHLKVSSFTN